MITLGRRILFVAIVIEDVSSERTGVFSLPAAPTLKNFSRNLEVDSSSVINRISSVPIYLKRVLNYMYTAKIS